MPETLQAFHFLRPGWLLAILPALALAVLWARRRRAGSPWRKAVAPELLAVLLESRQNRAGRWAPWTVALALLLGALGLAGPTWQRLPEPVEQRNDGLVILLDLSLSMYAQDLPPSRLTRAQHKIADVLRRRNEGFTALVAYAGDAHVVTPLTDDARTIENLLTALNPAMMPVLGSNPGAAMDLAQELLRNAGLEQGRILMVTDGVDTLKDVTDRCSDRHVLSILGVGTGAGGLIPLDPMGQPGKHLTSQRGAPVRAALDSERLRTLAQLCRGRYSDIDIGDSDIAHLLAAPASGAAQGREVERSFDAWADLGYWCALALLPFLLASFRRGFMAGLAVVLLGNFAPLPAQAGLWEDLWWRRDQQGYAALNSGRTEDAAALFQNQDWRSAARYRGDDYQGAAAGWREGDGATDSYNLGNALAKLGDYEAASEAYAKALAAAPDHEDAAFNKQLVEQLLEQQAEQTAQSGEQEESQGQQDESEEQSGQQQQAQSEEQAGSGQQAEPQNESPESAAEQQGDEQATELGEAEAQLEEAGRSEQQEALEQWLRRVPDDPGGLLRRKFQHETNQRLRRGDYSSRQQDKVW